MLLLWPISVQRRLSSVLEREAIERRLYGLSALEECYSISAIFCYLNDREICLSLFTEKRGWRRQREAEVHSENSKYIWLWNVTRPVFYSVYVSRERAEEENKREKYMWENREEAVWAENEKVAIQNIDIYGKYFSMKISVRKLRRSYACEEETIEEKRKL